MGPFLGEPAAMAKARAADGSDRARPSTPRNSPASRLIVRFYAKMDAKKAEPLPQTASSSRNVRAKAPPARFPPIRSPLCLIRGEEARLNLLGMACVSSRAVTQSLKDAFLGGKYTTPTIAQAKLDANPQADGPPRSCCFGFQVTG